MKELVVRFLQWAATSSKYWSGYCIMYLLEDANYKVSFGELMYVGNASDNDANSLNSTFGDFRKENMLTWDTSIYDTYFDKTLKQDPETINVAYPSDVWTSVLLNSSTLTEKAEKIADTLNENWLGRCLKSSNTPCTGLYMFHLTWPKDDDNITGNQYFIMAFVHLKKFLTT